MSGNMKTVIQNGDKFTNKQAIAIVRQCFSINTRVPARLLQSINELNFSVSEKCLFGGNRPRRIKRKVFVGNRPRRIKKNCIRRDSRRITTIL